MATDGDLPMPMEAATRTRCYSVTPPSTVPEQPAVHMPFKRKRFSKWMQLSSLTLVYVVGELSHFLLGVVTTPMSQEIHYGDHGCLPNPHPLEGVPADVYCYIGNSSENCQALWTPPDGNGTACVWDYSGLGLQYQLLAGPAFVAVFTVAGLLTGVLADRLNRVRLLTVCLGVLTTATALLGAATEYWQLVVLRMVVGAGESAFAPTSTSLISDLFPQTVRAFALGVFNVGIYLGYGLAYLVGNYLTAADIFDLGWRSSYYVSGLLGAVVLVLLMVLVHDPKTDAGEDGGKHGKRNTVTGEDNEAMTGITGEAATSHEQKLRFSTPTDCAEASATTVDANPNFSTIALIPPSTHLSMHPPTDPSIHPTTDLSIPPSTHSLLRGFKRVVSFEYCRAVSSPAFLLLCLAASVRHTGGFTWAYNTQLYFQTYYPDFPVGVWVSSMSIVGGTAGVVGGGLVADRLVKKIGPRARLYVLAASQIVATPLAAGVLLLPPPGAMYSLLASYLFAEMWFGILFAVLMDVVHWRVRARALATFLFVMNNVGGNAPVLVEPLRKAIGYRSALLVMYPGCFGLSSALFLLTSPLVRGRTAPELPRERDAVRDSDEVRA